MTTLNPELLFGKSSFVRDAREMQWPNTPSWRKMRADLLVGGLIYAINLAVALVGLPVGTESPAYLICLGFWLVAMLVGANVVVPSAVARAALHPASLILLVFSGTSVLILHLRGLNTIVAGDAGAFAFVGGLVGAEGGLVRNVLIILVAIFLLATSLTWPFMKLRSCEHVQGLRAAESGAESNAQGKPAGRSSRLRSEGARPPKSDPGAPVNEGEAIGGVAAAPPTGRDRSFGWTTALCVAVVGLYLIAPTSTFTAPKLGTSTCTVVHSEQTNPSATGRPTAANELPPKVEVPTVEPNRSAVSREGPKDGRRGGPRLPP